MIGRTYDSWKAHDPADEWLGYDDRDDEQLRYETEREENEMKISSAFPSKFLKASDLQDRNIPVRMSHVDIEDIGDGNKPVLYFLGKDKGLVLNKTNSKVIASAYGDDTDTWKDKPLILFPALVDFRGDQVEAIRCRVPKATTAAAATFKKEPEPPPVEEIPERDEMDDSIPF